MTKETIYTDEEGVLFMYLASYEYKGEQSPLPSGRKAVQTRRTV
jgi:hypothetical protein